MGAQIRVTKGGAQRLLPFQGNVFFIDWCRIWGAIATLSKRISFTLGRGPAADGQHGRWGAVACDTGGHAAVQNNARVETIQAAE